MIVGLLQIQSPRAASGPAIVGELQLLRVTISRMTAKGWTRKPRRRSAN